MVDNMDDLKKSRQKKVEREIFGRITKDSTRMGTLGDHMDYATMQGNFIRDEIKDLNMDAKLILDFFDSDKEEMLYECMEEAVRIIDDGAEEEYGDVPVYKETMGYFISDRIRDLQQLKEKADKIIALIEDYKRCYIDSL